MLQSVNTIRVYSTLKTSWPKCCRRYTMNVCVCVCKSITHLEMKGKGTFLSWSIVVSGKMYENMLYQFVCNHPKPMQLQILHRIISTMDIVSTPVFCLKCKAEISTLTHCVWCCHKLQTYWSSVWLEVKNTSRLKTEYLMFISRSKVQCFVKLWNPVWSTWKLMSTILVLGFFF